MILPATTAAARAPSAPDASEPTSNVARIRAPRLASADPPPRVLILTAGFGEGHNAAARNLAAAFDAALAPGAARVADVFALASPRLNAVSRRGYLALINRAPRVWQSIYGWLDRSQFPKRSLRLLRGETRVLGELLAAERPAAVCCTYPIYAFMLARLAREGRAAAPWFNVVTDAISINSIWWRAPCAGWFVTDADSASVLLRAGVAPGLVHDCGFPTPAFIADHAHLAPPDLACGARPRLLCVINSVTRDATAMLRPLLAETDWELTVAVGRDARLRRTLEKLAVGRAAPATILGWTDQIPRLLLTHHLVLSKAGGATTQESIAARCPMIVNQIVPGQEEGNYELLSLHGSGELAETPSAILAACRRAFADGGKVWREWRAALTRLSRPAAARGIAARVLAQVTNPPVSRSAASPTLNSLPP
jgi:processive 1,2-diacylglycerol beta-glucosyltransferase